MTTDTVIVKVPGTTANLGAGFDCIGAALTVSNQLRFTQQEPDAPLHITTHGLDAERINTDQTNLVYQVFCQFYARLQRPLPGLHLDIELGVPLSRGLGSSATAIVGGLVGANAIAGFPVSQEVLLRWAIALEGHPDNVVPAFLGGCQLSVPRTSVGTTKPTWESAWDICDIPWHESIVPVVASPNFELSTQAAREVLPAQYSRTDAIFNAAHLGLLIRGLGTGEVGWLATALDDRIHQPYRKTLIKGYDAVRIAALDAGAYGIVISGAGPTLLALTQQAQAQTVVTTMATAWAELGIAAQAKVLALDRQGTQIKTID